MKFGEIFRMGVRLMHENKREIQAEGKYLYYFFHRQIVEATCGCYE